MKKIIYIILGVVGGVIALVVISGIVRYLLMGNNVIEPGKNAPDVENMSYVIGKEVFNLKDGKASNDYIKGSKLKNNLAVEGETVYGDLNGDGSLDAATFLVNKPGENGVFFFAVLALNDNGVFKPSNTIFLGNRLENTSVRIDSGHAVFSFGIKEGADSLVDKPLVKKSVWMDYDKTKNEISESNKNAAPENPVSNE